jgi:four helix bundle protein
MTLRLSFGGRPPLGLRARLGIQTRVRSQTSSGMSSNCAVMDSRDHGLTGSANFRLNCSSRIVGCRNCDVLVAGLVGRNQAPTAADNLVMSPGPRSFDHHRLDAFCVARDALRLGDSLARRMPRGYATLQDQLRRALLSAYLGIAEASSRTGADRISRFRTARGEASEAAAALEAVAILGLAPDTEVEAVMSLLDRLCAMLTRLAGMHRHQP